MKKKEMEEVTPDAVFKAMSEGIITHDTEASTMSLFAYEALEKNEAAISRYCEDNPEESKKAYCIWLHAEMLLSLPFRLLSDGVTKKEIMKAVSKMCDSDINTIEMLEANHNRWKL